MPPDALLCGAGEDFQGVELLGRSAAVRLLPERVQHVSHLSHRIPCKQAPGRDRRRPGYIGFVWFETYDNKARA